MSGVPTGNVWDDIPPISSHAKERLGYPTQKPLALLERIIEASSNPGDVVLDPFCGCGTAVVAAQKLNRKWIGIDITHLAVSLIRTRLIDTFGDEITDQIEVIGDPKDAGAARALFDQDPYQFEWWALSLVNAMPANDKKKGADRGIDGEIRFHVDTSGKVQRCLVQVKGGGVNSSVIRDLKGTMEREKAVMGILITLQPPSRPRRWRPVSTRRRRVTTSR
jgi:site-specific DNA-methyltransferase (adenine-specific)